MHFTGMLAFRVNLPLPGTYDLPLTVLSLVVAIAISGVALFLASGQTLGHLKLWAGGVFMGIGIASMHYTGMAAMRAPCVWHYDPVFVAASLGIAIAASMAALWLAFQVRRQDFEGWSWRRVGSAAVMGAAIAGMHYTGMASGHYVPYCGVESKSWMNVTIPGLGASAIGMGTFLIFGVAVLSSYRERLRWQQDLMKDRFLGILSHELRTPINAIMGFGSILDDELEGPLNEAQHRRMGQILKGADTLLALIEDMLVMSSVQAGQFSLRLGPMAFPEVVKEAVTGFEPELPKRRLQLRVEVPDDLPELVADARRINQVLSNLISNAIKFTPEGGTVTVRACLDGNGIRCEVSDTGIGIAPRDIAKLFHPFTQLDMSETRRVGGTGLGLSVCKALIEAHGGAIGVESSVGQGSTFWFRLPRPLGKAAPGPDQAAEPQTRPRVQLPPGQRYN
jgi:signal transduction histidine kinase